MKSILQFNVHAMGHYDGTENVSELAVSETTR